jgi:ribosomal protein L16 Arg81 hydroxylase
LRDHVIDRVNAYISPPGFGTPLHFDIRSVCIVQLFGEKVWRIAETQAVPDPARNCVLPPGAASVRYGDRDIPAPGRLRTHRLRPGDWLLVPRGVWHETLSGGGSVSVSLAAPEGQ